MTNEREPITPEELEGFPARNNVDGAVEDRMLRAASTIRDLRERLAGAKERYLADLNLESTRLQARVARLQTKLAKAEGKLERVRALRPQAAYLGREYHRLRQTPLTDRAFAEAVGLVGHAATRFDELEAALADPAQPPQEADHADAE